MFPKRRKYRKYNGYFTFKIRKNWKDNVLKIKKRTNKIKNRSY